MARVHHDGAVRYGKKAGDGLLQDVGRLALDDRSDPEEALLHVGVHSLWIVEQQRVEPGQKLRQVLGGLRRLVQIACEVAVDAPAARVGFDAAEPRGAIGLVASKEYLLELLLHGLLV